MQLLTESTTKSNVTTAPHSGATNVNVKTPAPVSGNMAKFYPPKPKINAFNELFKCHLCQGYMINPTTIDACMHTYCRSCIARHLAVDCYCPQCKGNGGKALTISNLKSDDVLRSIIYKLVPGLYQKERERIVQFVNNTKNEGQFVGGSGPATSLSGPQTPEAKTDVLECDEDFFSPTDPISLSLEYHPHLASQCPESAVPPVRYLQCPASVKIQHLKRFLCSKFDIDPCNRRVGIEIIYEDEVLPSDFTLMDVGYCYQWKRHGPLKFLYRILIYSDEQNTKPENGNAPADQVSDKSSATYLGHSVQSPDLHKSHEKSPTALNGDCNTKSLPASPFLPPPPHTAKVKSSKSSASKHVQSSSSSSSSTPSVKMTITSRPVESKKSVSKRSSGTEDFVLPTTNDFKSLRSNDIRYSHYAVTASTTNPPSASASPVPSTTKTKVKSSAAKEEKPAKCDIVVSIPHNQMQDEWESKPLSQLKTASKKSPNPPTGSITSTTNVADSSTAAGTKKVKNQVPKLKIELNSLKTKLIEKPKSADIRLDTLMIKHYKPRKFSLDESQQPNDRVDLQTYVKNIGLKPIEVQTTSAVAEMELPEKFTPNASPRSSCSSSTTSSSNGHLHVAGEISTSSSSSSHKKRKKKHSKEPRDSKRKKLHAEISSHTDEESLKMKVKLTAPLNIKPSKFDSKKSPQIEKPLDPLAFEKSKLGDTKPKITFEKPLLPASKPRDVEKDKSKLASEKKLKDALKLKPLAIRTSSKEFEDDDDIVISDGTTSLLTSFSKPLTNLKEAHLPHSPPLPPSLFKTTTLTFSTFTPNVNVTVAKPKPVVIAPKHARDKPAQPNKMKPLAPKPMPVKPLPAPMKPPQFAVPNLPRLMASNSSKFHTSTPTSIASAANKQMGSLLKRSISLDEAKTSTGSLAKQAKTEKPHQITVSAYGSNLQVTRVEIPATPTSSTAKATFEIPLYSPLSASYNPKCSFTVGSSSAVAKAAKVPLPISLNSGGPSSSMQMFTTSTATKKSDKEMVKTTTSGVNSVCKTSPPLMGPPLPIAKLNTVVPTTVKSPPLGSVVSLQPTIMTHTQTVVSPVTVNSRTALNPTSPSQLMEKKPEVSAIGGKTTNGPLSTTVDKPKSSLRQFRLPSRESGQDILDLSAAPVKSVNGVQATEKKSMATVSIPASPTTSTAGSSLELALTKIKQNITNSVGPDSKHSSLDMKPNSDDLQNLHLLSESATAREKIAINASPTSSSASTSSLYEKPKINQNSLVRQQNASVRSIPNPSALAFRNHQPTNTIPMVTIAAPLVASLTNDPDKLLLSKQPSSPHSPLNAMPESPNYTTSSTSPSRTTTATTTLSTKRHPSIDQVAASLNIRASAAAAAEASAKANLKPLEETAMVSSPSPLTEISGGGSKLKQIKQETVEQTSAATTPHIECVRPSSTVHSPATSSEVVVEIKKEPEDRFNESSSSSLSLSLADEQRDVKAVLATTSALALAAAPSSLTSKVENLVTSVINVSTPTSTLLTASSAGF